MPSAADGRVTVAIPGGSTFTIHNPKKLVSSTIQRLTPVARQDAAISYSSYDTRGGVTWDVLARSYLGCGKFLADDGGYGIAKRADLRFGQVIPGPRVEADYPGIPGNLQVLGHVQWNATDFVWTDSSTAGNQVYRRASAGSTWTNPWTGLPSAAATCMVALGNYVAIGFGAGTAFYFMGTDPNSATAWTASTKTGNAKFMDVATTISNDDTTNGARAVYGVQSSTAGETFFVTSLANGGTDTTGSYVGESGTTTADAFNSVVVAADGTLLWGKKRRLYAYDTAGVVTGALGTDFEVKTASDDGVSGSVPKNFRDPVAMPNGYIYWIVGDYDILEREPVNGSFSYKSLRLFGPDTPLMQLPVLAICNVENELMVAVGTTSGSVFDVTKFPAGAQLIANTITDGTSYLFAGAYRIMPDGSERWVYHGYLAELTSMLMGFMWYSRETKRLFFCSNEDDASLVVLRTQDNLSSATLVGAITLDSQGTAADGDYLYIGSLQPFSGVYFNLDNFNGNGSILTVRYWDGSAWTDISATDGTAPGGITMATDGSVTWSVPGAWIKDDLVTINSPTPGSGGSIDSYKSVDYYWARFEFSATLDGSTNGVQALTASGVTQKVARLLPGNPLVFKLDGTNVILSPDDWTVETGKFIDLRPNVVKTGRRIQAQAAGLASDDPKLRLYYRTAGDDDTATGFTEMPNTNTTANPYNSGFTSVANARTGIAFPDNTEYRGIRLQIQSDDDGNIGEYTYGIVYGVQLLWLDYSARQKQLEIAFTGSNTNVTPEGVAVGEGKDSWKNYVEEWQAAKTPATITLVERGASWPMDLVDGYPIINELTNEIVVVAREVVA